MFGVDQIFATAMTIVSGVISIVQLRKGWRHAWFVASVSVLLLSAALWLHYNHQINIDNLSTNEQSARAGNVFRAFWEVSGSPCKVTLSATSQDKRLSQTWEVQSKGDREIGVPKDIEDTSVSVVVVAYGCIGGTLLKTLIVPIRETRFSLLMNPDKFAHVGDLITVEWSTNGSSVSFEVNGLPSLNRLQVYHDPSGHLSYRAKEAGDGSIRAFADGPGGRRQLRFTYQILEPDPSSPLASANKPFIERMDFQEVVSLGTPLSLHWVVHSAKEVALLQWMSNSTWQTLSNYSDGEGNASIGLSAPGVYQFRLLAKSDSGTSSKDFNVTVKPQTSIREPPAIQSPIRSSVVEAMLVRRVMPQYPPIAKQMRLQGVVVLAATIGADGRVRDVQIESGSPVLRKAAADAVMNWVYRPATVDGVAVESKSRIEVNFNLDK